MHMHETTRATQAISNSGAAAAVVTAAAGRPDAKRGRQAKGNNADTPPPPRYLPIHHPTRSQQAARNATQRSLSFTGKIL